MSQEIRLSESFSRRYRILSRLGRGGAGMVFRAAQRELRRTVAIKFVDPELFSDPVALQRFGQEAMVTAEMQHPNVLRVIEAGVDSGPEGELPYIVYELIEGSDLGSVLKEHGRRLPPDRALSTMVDVLRGLECAHSQTPPILHRDIKPDNVLVSKEGQVKVADFGIAKREGHGPKTQTGMVVGTPTYMSPEQAQGLPLTPSSDLYSTAVMAFECLVGRPPFVAGSGMEVAVMHVRDDPPIPSQVAPELPPQIDAILLRGLDKNPTKRFASAGEFADALEAARKNWSRWRSQGSRSPAAVPTPQALPASQPTDAMPERSTRGPSTGLGSPVAAKGSQTTRALSRSQVALSSVQPTVGPAVSDETKTRLMLLAAGLGLAGLTAVGLFLYSMVSKQPEGPKAEDFTPLDAKVETGTRAATLEWRTAAPYVPKVSLRPLGDVSREEVLEPLESSPTSLHTIYFDSLRPGAKYEYQFLLPGGDRSLHYPFQTKKYRFLKHPRAQIRTDGTLVVEWTLDQEARAEVLVRPVDTSSASRRASTSGYEAKAKVEIPGWKVHDDLEYKILFYGRWWDRQIKQKVPKRVGPEFFTKYRPIQSLHSRYSKTLETLESSLRSLRTEFPRPPRSPTEIEKLQAARVRVQLDHAVGEFSRIRNALFDDEILDPDQWWDWYRSALEFRSWIQSLERAGQSLGFEVQELFPESLRPYGTTRPARSKGASAFEVPFLFEDREDPDFEPVFSPSKTYPLEARGNFDHADWMGFAIEVSKATPGSKLHLMLRPETWIEFEIPADADFSKGSIWLYHTLAPGLVVANQRFRLGMYNGRDVSPDSRIEVGKIRLFGDT